MGVRNAALATARPHGPATPVLCQPIVKVLFKLPVHAPTCCKELRMPCMHVQVMQALTLQRGGSRRSSSLPQSGREQAPTGCAQDDSVRILYQQTSAAAVQAEARRV
jgi:hypothetical protein